MGGTMGNLRKEERPERVKQIGRSKIQNWQVKSLSKRRTEKIGRLKLYK